MLCSAVKNNTFISCYLSLLVSVIRLARTLFRRYIRFQQFCQSCYAHAIALVRFLGQLLQIKGDDGSG